MRAVASSAASLGSAVISAKGEQAMRHVYVVLARRAQAASCRLGGRSCCGRGRMLRVGSTAASAT
jgi:hypothetical protein